MISEGYWKLRIKHILEHKSSKDHKIDNLFNLMLEVEIHGRDELASELRNLLRVKEDREIWPNEE